LKIKWTGMALFIAIMTLFLYQLIEDQASTQPVLVPIFAFFVFGVIDQVIKEKKEKPVPYVKTDFYGVIFLLLGFFLTLGLYALFSVPQVIASSLIGLIGYVWMKPYEKEVYCGTFAGMLSLVFFSFLNISMIALLLSITWLISKQFFQGLGGKLGTTAFVAGFLVIAISPSYQVVMPDSILNISVFVLIPFAYITIAVLWLLKNKYQLNAVLASSAFSLLAGLILQQFAFGFAAMTVVFASSFVIMSDQNKFNSSILIFISPIILSFVYVHSYHIFMGFGGKAGLMALITVISTRAIQLTVLKIKPEKSNKVQTSMTL
jgi:hypothetical protein